MKHKEAKVLAKGNAGLNIKEIKARGSMFHSIVRGEDDFGLMVIDVLPKLHIEIPKDCNDGLIMFVFAKSDKLLTKNRCECLGSLGVILIGHQKLLAPYFLNTPR